MSGNKAIAVIGAGLVIGVLLVVMVGISLANGPWNGNTTFSGRAVPPTENTTTDIASPRDDGRPWGALRNTWGTMMGSWGGMMGGGMMGGGMMGGWTGSATGSPISDEEAIRIAEEYVAGYGNSDLEVAEIMVFDNQFYVQAREASTGRYAFEFLIDRYTGAAYPEPGPNMMWNTRYGHMGGSGWGSFMGGGMMGGGWSTGGEMSVTPEEALQLAQAYLDRTQSGLTVADEADAFYGYYTIHTLRNGQVVGMLSVNGYTGEVWPHTWHGTYIGMIGDEDH